MSLSHNPTQQGLILECFLLLLHVKNVPRVLNNKTADEFNQPFFFFFSFESILRHGFIHEITLETLFSVVIAVFLTQVSVICL